MAKARSPGYPAIGLREAIEKIRAVYEKDYQNRLPRSVAAAHMGYQSLNGKSLGVLSAVAKFGLLEGRGEENRVSDLALQIIAHPPGTPERAKAIVEAAARPELFGDLDDRFQGGKASDATLRSYLITKKFIPQAADAVVRSYRETKALVAEEAGGYSAETVHSDEVQEPDMMQAGTESATQRPYVRSLIGAPTVGEREFSRGQLSREGGYRLLVSGTVGAKELAKIIRVLTLQKELLAENEGEASGDPEE